MSQEQLSPKDRSYLAALRTISSLIEERQSDASCVRDISYLLTLCGVSVRYQILEKGNTSTGE